MALREEITIQQVHEETANTIQRKREQHKVNILAGKPCSATGLACCRIRFVCLLLSRPKAETPRSAAEKGFIHQAVQGGDGRTALRPTSLKVRGSHYLWDKAEAWGAQGKIMRDKKKGR